jgi:hypothetical protein
MAAYWDTEDAGDETFVGAKVQFNLAGSAVDIEARAAMFDDLEDLNGPVPFRLDAFPLEIGIAYNFNRGASLNPYLGGGFGYYFLDIERLEPDRTATIDDEFGWYGVLGIEVGFDEQWSLFLEGLYRNTKGEISGDGLDDIDTFGLDLVGLAVNAGVLFSW